MKNQGHITPPLYQLELISFTTPQSVSSLTTLLPFTDLGSANQSLMIVLENQDSTNTVDLIVDISHGGVRANSGRSQRVTAQPLDEASIEIAAPNPYGFFRIAAVTASPGFPTVSIKWAVVVGQR